ncbi:transmembrane signal receptor [Lithospermum erythrorhizon]|uniref:Transmembrane signal receptor n=1 Tax=Lithospermum erythrorhizon TaxID=34254 RepID=A0AAV3PGM0_LITER
MNDKAGVFCLFTRFLAIVECQFDARVKTVRSDNGTEFFCLKQYFAERGIIFQTSYVGTHQETSYVGYLINRKPSQVLGFKTPYEYLFGKPPNLTELRVFGSLCYVHNLQAKSDKFSSRNRKCVFLGYPFGKKGWKVYNLDTKELFVSRDVQFAESVFPFATIDSPMIDSEQLDVGVAVSDEDEDLLAFNSPLPTHDSRQDRMPEPLPGPGPDDAHEADDGHAGRVSSPTVINEAPSEPSLGRGVEPKSFEEAMRDSRWRAAMQAKIQTLENNHTWTLASLPPGKQALGSRWIYKVKHKLDGTVERFKARLVVFGNHHIEGIDYSDTFALVARMVTVRTFLAVAAAKDWELHQMDVHNAFLHGDLTKEVYMKIPPGFEQGRCGQVCRLRKSLYGLKHAPRSIHLPGWLNVITGT